MIISREQADEAILKELGARIARHRLNRNLSQEALAREAGIAKRTLHRVEHGEATNVTNLIRLLRALDLLENLESLVPAPAPSPIQQLKLLGKQRRRASSASATETPREPWRWGDEE